MKIEETPCPCGSGKLYSACCQPCHLTKRAAETAVALMRSRYSAYVVENERYLLDTWHHSTRPVALDLLAEAGTKWIGLKVIQTQKGQVGDSEGSVEFVARYKINGKAHKLHEVSRFVKESGIWFYVSGDIQA